MLFGKKREKKNPSAVRIAHTTTRANFIISYIVLTKDEIEKENGVC